ncbi:MAG: crotonase/enoyl-CoA hydratase family protein [Frankiaceae bacterium]|nr:crotonase/enoyl-CoA hydratase family protein [Frankiaceae bacterium]
MADRVSVTVESGVADVRMVRAEKMNAIDPAMFLALAETGEELKSRRDVRAVVLSGEGRAFCAGLDMDSMQQLAAPSNDSRDTVLDDAAKRTAAGANLAQQACYVWREVPVPVIAAVHGVAYGGGFQLTLGADIRIVAPDVRLAIMEIKWGLVPDMSGIVLLRRLVRDDVARELTWTGRILDGEEAVQLGIATRVADDPRAAALAMAREIASKSPDAIRAGKRLLNLAQTDATAAEIFLAESSEQRALIGGANQIESVMANFEKRPPVFND